MYSFFFHLEFCRLQKNLVVLFATILFSKFYPKIQPRKVGNPGTIDVPGGHPEPKNCGHNNPNDPFTPSNQTIATEMTTSCREEICAELNLQPQEITSHKFHSIIAKMGSDKPLGYFVTQVSLTAEEIVERHRQGGPETDEFDKLLFYTSEALAEKYFENKEFSLNACLATGVYLHTLGRVSGQEIVEIGKKNCVKDEC